MQVRDLIKRMNNFDIKVIFESGEVLSSRISEGRSPIYFVPVRGKERKKYDNLSDKRKKTFTSNSAAIYIGDLSVRELVDIFECDGTGIHEFTTSVIAPYCEKYDISKDIVYVLFLFLHEVGHWNQFKNLEKNVFDFVNMDVELYKRNFDEMQILNNKIREQNACSNIDVGQKLTFYEMELLKKLMEEYRNIPKEKEADEFALGIIDDVLTSYKTTE